MSVKLTKTYKGSLSITVPEGTVKFEGDEAFCDAKVADAIGADFCKKYGISKENVKPKVESKAKGKGDAVTE